MSERGMGVPSSEGGQGVGVMRRVFKDTQRSPRWHRPHWMKDNGQQEGPERGGGQEGDHSRSLSPGVNHRSTKDLEDGRGEFAVSRKLSEGN